MEKLRILSFCKKYGVSKQWIYSLLPTLRHEGPQHINKAGVTIELIETIMDDEQSVRYLKVTPDIKKQS